MALSRLSSISNCIAFILGPPDCSTSKESSVHEGGAGVATIKIISQVLRERMGLLARDLTKEQSETKMELVLIQALSSLADLDQLHSFLGGFAWRKPTEILSQGNG